MSLIVTQKKFTTSAIISDIPLKKSQNHPSQDIWHIDYSKPAFLLNYKLSVV